MSAVALFGKMPRAADFVRHGVSTDALRHFASWFHDSYIELRRAGAPGLTSRCHLIFPSPNDRGGVVAAVALPSRDRIGREFPIIVAVSLPREQCSSRSALLILAFARFSEAASRTAETHLNDEPETMWQAVRSLAPPGDAELSEAERHCDELLATLRAREMEQECFSDPDDRFYAYHTLQLAVRDAPETRVLVCPTANKAGYRAFWVETIQRAMKSKVSLPTMWLDGPEAPSAVLVALGKPPTAMLPYATGHAGSSRSLWPLTTQNPTARARAKSALDGEAWDDGEQSLARLIDSVLGAGKKQAMQ